MWSSRKVFWNFKQMWKTMCKEFDSKYENYRDLSQKGKIDYINNNLNMLPFHKELSKLNINKTQMDFDATSLYPSAMWDKKSVYLKIETGFAFEPQMTDVFVNVFNNRTSDQDGNDSAVKHLPVEEKVEKI